MRKPIPTKVHGVLDYPAFLHTLPRVMGWSRQVTATLDAAGASATAYSLMTDYELGAVKALPMRVHLALDALGGTALAAAPWVSGEAKRGLRYWLPHALVGSSELALAFLTKTEPDSKPRRAARLIRRGR